MADKLLDYKEALERLGGDEQFLNELLEELIKQVDQSVVKFRQAIEEKDYGSLKSMAHSLKGASANLNVTRMSAHFYDLEKLAASNSVDGAEKMLDLAVKDKIELQDFLNSGIPV